MRDVVKGEELTVSYLSNHAARAVRQNSCQTNWGFTCECPKCNDEPDTYAAALERALAEAEGRAPDTQKPPPSRGDSLEDREREVMTRIKLLRGIVNAVGDDDPASSKARMKEFVMV
jgi:hypothetical protein